MQTIMPQSTAVRCTKTIQRPTTSQVSLVNYAAFIGCLKMKKSEGSKQRTEQRQG